MDATSSRSPVRTTYLQRSKHKRKSSERIDAKPDSEDDAPSQRDAPAPSTKPTPRASKANVVKTTISSPSLKSIPNKQLPRQIDLRDVPGPAPKRTRRNSDEGSEKSVAKSTPMSKSIKSGHIRTSSTSITSLNPVKTVPVAASSPALSKRGSVRGSQARNAKPTSKAASISQTILGDDDEGESVADSFADSVVSTSAGGGRMNRSVKDRQEYFKNQPDCHVFGPHRVVCSRCKQVVTLIRRQTFAVGPWERHRAKCDQELASDSPLPPNADELVNASVDEIFRDQPVRRSLAERRAILVADEYIETTEEDRVKCAKCENWVALQKSKPYDLSKWLRHRKACIPEVPSDRVLSAERKLAIVNDPLVLNFDTASIECSRCGAKVPGSSGQDYDISAWEEHKSQCRSHSQAGASEGVNVIPFPAQSSGKPPSNASTGSTLVAAEATVDDIESTPQSLAKRPREEGSDDDRPQNRPRTETYEPPAAESPGVLGWFMLPFASFARGFRESLKNEPSPS